MQRLYKKLYNSIQAVSRRDLISVERIIDRGSFPVGNELLNMVDLPLLHQIKPNNNPPYPQKGSIKFLLL